MEQCKEIYEKIWFENSEKKITVEEIQFGKVQTPFRKMFSGKSGRSLLECYLAVLVRDLPLSSYSHYQ